MLDADDIARLRGKINSDAMRRMSYLGVGMSSKEEAILKILENLEKVSKTEKPNKKKISKYPQVEKRHKYIWRIIKPISERMGSYDEMRAAIRIKKQIVIGKDKHVPVPNNATLNIIIEKYSGKQNETE